MMASEFDISLEFQRITEAMEEMAPFSELAEDTLRLLIVLAQENERLRKSNGGAGPPNQNNNLS